MSSFKVTQSMKIEGFGNKSNHQLSDSANQLGTGVTSNSFRKTVGIISTDKNIDKGFCIEVGSNKMRKSTNSLPKVND